MPCHPPRTKANKSWPYAEYYIGERDKENRKNGMGTHHWSGAESLEWYVGRMLRDTIHGYGDYRWRYLVPNHTAVSYEGRFYNNEMHGYGVVSYPDGRVFTGLFHNNIRWGPGVVSHACLREDVGLWYGYQLIRLAWRPAAPSVTIDFTSNPIGCNVVAPQRVLLTTNSKVIGAVNSAIELLKQYGSEPLAAADKWTKLYPKSCTDTHSQLCHVEIFDRAYYKNQIYTLDKITAVREKNQDDSQNSDDSIADKIYYAWNNSEIIIHMMKHCFTHEYQRKGTGVNLAEIMSGPRSSFKTAGKHELDCRTVLMASYLGHITNVAQLVNEYDVIPDIADLQGNSALMYAACGDQPEIIHFLVSAGAEVDAYNDACCTPLGIALLRYALEKWDIPYNGMLQALLPPTSHGPPLPDEKVLEWNMSRDSALPSNSIQKSPSKLSNKSKRMPSVKDLPAYNSKRKSDAIPKPEAPKTIEADQSVPEEMRLYTNITNEYLIKVVDSFTFPIEITSIPYIFDVRDMNKDVETSEEEQKKLTEKNPKKNASKVLKDITKPSRDMMWQDKEDHILDAKEQMKQEKMNRIMSTILQLLSEGADPRKIRCPQPPLFIASVSGCADLVRELINHGADINEVYLQAFGYTTLDLAVSGPFTFDNLDVIRSLLECGADVDHRLPVPETPVPTVDAPAIFKDDGPTLLHAVMARKIDFEPEDEIRRQILELLLKYGCNPITQWRGRSAVDVAMSKQPLDILDIFIKSPRTDLNAVINDSNQSILLKMFYLPYCKTIPLSERLQTLTNLLLYGADPLVKCRNGNDEYANLFVYARKVLSELQIARKPPSPSGNLKKSKSEVKPKKSDKTKKDDKGSLEPVKSVGQASKLLGKSGEDGDYKQALDLVVECARLLYIRWLQAKLMKELIDIVSKYRHRSWNTILKEHKNKKAAGLWLTAVRCLEIWHVLRTTKKAKYNDDKILKYVLCIIHFYYKRTRKILRCPAMTFQEKILIEFEVGNFIHEHKLATAPSPEMVPPIRPYVTPELTVKEVEKFNVCFECAMPLADAKIPCSSCKLIAFCSFDCVKSNIDRINCHPCSSFLRDKYFPSPEETEPEADNDKV